MSRMWGPQGSSMMVARPGSGGGGSSFLGGLWGLIKTVFWLGAAAAVLGAMAGL